MTTFIEELFADIRYAVRSLRRSPLFAMTVVGILAIGIGANTAVLSIIDAAFLRKLPVAKPEQLFQIYSADSTDGRRHIPLAAMQAFVSWPDAAYLRSHAAPYTQLSAFGMRDVPLGDSLAGSSAYAALVLGNYFDLLGVHPQHGRLVDSTDVAQQSPVVVISDALWRSRFGAQPSIVGRHIVLARTEFTIIGVAPARFTGTHPEGRTDLWLPYTLAEQATGKHYLVQERGARLAEVIGRMSAGTTLHQIDGALANGGRELRRSFPAADAHVIFRASPRERLVTFEQAPSAFISLSVALLMIALVHLVACSNIASLVLARTAARRAELGVRAALGASRARIMGLVIVECGVLAIVGSAGGVAIARWSTGLITSMRFMSAMDSGLDFRLVALAFGIGAVTTILFGSLPARAAAQRDPLELIRGGNVPSAASANVVVVQFALSLLLLIEAAVLGRSLQRESMTDPGYRPASVLDVTLTLSDTLITPDQRMTRYDAAATALRERLAVMPGVEAVSISEGVPLARSGSNEPLSVASYAYSPTDDRSVSNQMIGPRYFATIGAHMARGREFTDRDRSAFIDVAIVNEAMAARYWPNHDPVGQRLTFRGHDVTVVGVVRDLHDVSPSVIRPRAYFPLLEWRLFPTFDVEIRVAGEIDAFRGPLRAQAQSAGFSVTGIQTLGEARDNQLAVLRYSALAFVVCGGLALLFSGIGLYALIELWATERRRELGIRLALGAPIRSVRVSLVARLVTPLLIATGIGVVVSVWAVLLERSAMGVVFALDPVAFASAVVVLLGIAVFAAYLPSRRASQMDPSDVLSSD